MPSFWQWVGLAGLVVAFGGALVVPNDLATSSIWLNPVAWGLPVAIAAGLIAQWKDKRRM